jgi:HTH-type transcriptional regulator/antitoxin HigA
MSRIETHPFQPDYVSPPGDTLRKRLAEMNLSQAELAVRAGLSTKHVNQIVQGLAPITAETAIVLERITGLSARFWNQREADYREGLLRTKSRTLTKDDEAWLDSLSIKELQKRQRIPNEKDRGRLFDAVLSFFGVADREAYERIWRGPVASFRRSQAFESHPGAVVSWLRIAQIESQSAKARPFIASVFRHVLSKIRSLTANGDPNRIVDLCAGAGVVVVFVPEIKGCRISGAAWWAAPSRAVIGLSDRYKQDDYFWFTFFHEAAHLLLHSKKETFVDDGTDSDLVEAEANRFAADFLIPPDSARLLRTFMTDADVNAFAHAIGIAPGIVVGRMQHDKIWDYSRGYSLKRSVRIVEA